MLGRFGRLGDILKDVRVVWGEGFEKLFESVFGTCLEDVRDYWGMCLQSC